MDTELTGIARPSSRLLQGLLACLLCAPAAAQSNPADSGSAAEYRSTTDAGLAAYQAHLYVAAREHFARAHALQPSARTFRALGVTDLALDEYTRARSELESALEERQQPLSDEQRREVEETLSWMRTSLGAVELSYEPAIGVALIDDKPVASGVVLLTPGRHRVQVTASGYRAHAQELQVDAATESPLRLHIVLPAEPLPPTAARSSGSSAWLWIGGAGVVLLAAGGTLFGIGMHNVAAVEDAGPPFESIADGKDQRAAGQWQTGTGLGLGVLGLAGLTTALVLKLSERDQERPPTGWTYQLGPGQLAIGRRF